MSTTQTTPMTAALPDRRVGLILFGVFQIVLGCLSGLMGLMIIGVLLLGPMAEAEQAEMMNVRMMIPGVAFYFVLAAGFVWLGIGSILARRWAWALTVVLSWLWLIMGVLGFLGFILFGGSMMWASMAQDDKAPPQMMLVMYIVMMAVMACVYILLPAVFLLFYHRASVRATCERRDPRIRWTDRCPMPVLALSIVLAMTAVCMPMTLASGCGMPLFGVPITGPAGAIVILLITLVLACLAWGIYRLRMAAWWATLLFWILATLNAVVTFSRMNLMEMYEQMGMPPAQLEIIQKSGMVESMSRWGPWLCLLGGAAWLGYVFYVRRYFIRNGGNQQELADTAEPPQANSGSA